MSQSARSKLYIVIAIIVAVVALTACGSNGDADAHYSLGSAKNCLGAERLSSYASTFFHTSQGSIAFGTSKGEVVMAFGRDHKEAVNVTDGLKAAGMVFGAGRDDVADVDSYVRVKGNVAYWSNADDGWFAEGDEDRITKCLESSVGA